MFRTNDLFLFESTFLWISFISILISMTYLDDISVKLFRRMANSYLLPVGSSMGFAKLSLRIIWPIILIAFFKSFTHAAFKEDVKKA